jgi:hypothetical protein
MDIVLKKFSKSVLQDCSGRRHPKELSSQQRRITYQVINHLRTNWLFFWKAMVWDISQETNICLPLKNPKTLKGFLKSNIPMVLKSNKKSWFTRALFQWWFCHNFCPAVKIYFRKNNMAHEVLMIIKNALGHPKNIDELDDDDDDHLLSLNKTPTLQHMEHNNYNQGSTTLRSHLLMVEAY